MKGTKESLRAESYQLGLNTEFFFITLKQKFLLKCESLGS